jgi:hypothetical protein
MIKVRMSRNDMVKIWLEKPTLDSHTRKRLKSLSEFREMPSRGRYMGDIDACARKLIANESEAN